MKEPRGSVSESGESQGCGRPVGGERKGARGGEARAGHRLPPGDLTLRVSSQGVPGKADLPDNVVPAGGWRGSQRWAGLRREPRTPLWPSSGALWEAGRLTLQSFAGADRSGTHDPPVGPAFWTLPRPWARFLHVDRHMSPHICQVRSGFPDSHAPTHRPAHLRLYSGTCIWMTWCEQCELPPPPQTPACSNLEPFRTLPGIPLPPGRKEDAKRPAVPEVTWAARGRWQGLGPV